MRARRRKVRAGQAAALAATLLLGGCITEDWPYFDWDEITASWRGISWFPWSQQEEIAEEPPHGLIDTRAAHFGYSAADYDRFAGLRRARAYLIEQLAPYGRTLGEPIYIRVFKETAELEIWSRRSLDDPTGIGSTDPWTHLATYEICFFSGDLGPKLETGDWQSPEGLYRVGVDQLNPSSNYHFSFNLGFPNAFDQLNGRTGSYLMIHGDCVSIGCYAMTDGGIEEIYAFAEAALTTDQEYFRVDIFPARLTDEWLAGHEASPWHEFWSDLKPCYDRFETQGLIADDWVSNDRYVCG